MPSLVFHPIYSQLNLPFRHRFPIEKYQAIYTRLLELGVDPSEFYRPDKIDVDVLTRIFDPTYIKSLVNGTLPEKMMKRIGFPWSEQLIERTLTAVGGTIATVELALEHKTALNLTGGYHHAYANYGSGFCLVNDLYLGSLRALQSSNVESVLIFDCDVHQGDGTAKLAQNNAQIFTVSLHGEKNFPFRKQRSNLDFNLSKTINNEEYLDTVNKALELAINRCTPDFIIYDAGVDIHIDDDLGHLKISTDTIYQRDKLMFSKAKKLDIPIAAVIGGGYQRDINALTQVHIQLFRAAGIID